MGAEKSPDRNVKGLSAAQMVLLFLAGAAVCAIFFSAGFVVGYNEKSSKATPLTEQVAESPDVPPVIKQAVPSSATTARNSPPKVETPAIESDKSEPLRPTPLTAQASPPPAIRPTPKSAPKTEAAMAPARQSAAATVPTSLREPIGAQETYMIQVAASGTKADGEKLVKTLKSMNYPAVLVTPQQAHANDNLFRIQVGPFGSKESAERTKARLMHDGFKAPFIKH